MGVYVKICMHAIRAGNRNITFVIEINEKSGNIKVGRVEIYVSLLSKDFGFI